MPRLFKFIVVPYFFICQSLLELSYYGLVAGCGLSHLHAYLSAERQIYVNARSELDKSEMLVDVAILTLLGICHDASRHSTCYLSAQDVNTIRSCYDNVRMFVLFACLGQPCLVEVAVVVCYEFHTSVYGEPVGVYVEETHENTHHNAALVKVCVFVYFLNHYYTSVGWSYYNLLCVFAWENLIGQRKKLMTIPYTTANMRVKHQNGALLSQKRHNNSAIAAMNMNPYTRVSVPSRCKRIFLNFFILLIIVSYGVRLYLVVVLIFFMNCCMSR